MIELLAAIAALPVAVALAYNLPRLSFYLIGPVVFISLGGFFATHKSWFFFFQSEGSAAGLVVPVLMWIALMYGCLIGTVLMSLGWARARKASPGVSAVMRQVRRIRSDRSE